MNLSLLWHKRFSLLGQELSNTVVFVAENYLWIDWLFGEFEAHDDDLLTRIDEVCGGSIDTNDSGTRFTFDHVGLKARSGRGANDENFFSDPQASCIDQIFIDRNATDVVNVCFGDSGEMDFGAEKTAHKRKSEFNCFARFSELQGFTALEWEESEGLFGKGNEFSFLCGSGPKLVAAAKA